MTLIHQFFPENEREDRALSFAYQYHYGQVRKYTKEDYHNHPIEVANTVRQFGGSSDMVIAALLHDTVEDTDATLEDVANHFGAVVAMLVYWLTDIAKPEDGNRKKRKLINLGHLKLASPDAQTIKLADILSNTKSIAQHDPDFWKVYREEKLDQLAVLTKGNRELYTIVFAQVTEN